MHTTLRTALISVKPQLLRAPHTDRAEPRPSHSACLTRHTLLTLHIKNQTAAPRTHRQHRSRAWWQCRSDRFRLHTLDQIAQQTDSLVHHEVPIDLAHITSGRTGETHGTHA